MQLQWNARQRLGVQQPSAPSWWKADQCNSARRTFPLANRILATRLSLRQLPRSLFSLLNAWPPPLLLAQAVKARAAAGDLVRARSAGDGRPSASDIGRRLQNRRAGPCQDHIAAAETDVQSRSFRAVCPGAVGAD